jgi:hypothetical protein
MTAARLEELAKWAEFQSVHCQIDGSIDASVKYADLARCARAWAKVEKSLKSVRDVTLHGVDIGEGERWTWWPDDDSPSRAGSPIEAVEAAEVKP